MPRFMCPAIGAMSSHRTTSGRISKQDLESLTRLRDASSGLNVDFRLATFVRGVLDQRDQAARHEAPRAHRRASAGHLADLHHAAAGGDLDPSTGASGLDLERLRPLAGVHHRFDPIALHRAMLAGYPARGYDRPIRLA